MPVSTGVVLDFELAKAMIRGEFNGFNKMEFGTSDAAVAFTSPQVIQGAAPAGYPTININPAPLDIASDIDGWPGVEYSGIDTTTITADPIDMKETVFSNTGAATRHNARALFALYNIPAGASGLAGAIRLYGRGIALP
jgi:hypothetical protein